MIAVVLGQMVMALLAMLAVMVVTLGLSIAGSALVVMRRDRRRGFRGRRARRILWSATAA